MTISKTLITILFTVFLFNSSIAQPISRVFKNVALPSEKDPGTFMPIDTTMHLHALKISFATSDEVIHTYRYGTPEAYDEKLKRSNDTGFRNAPKEIRGHLLMGTYYDTANSFYNMYYLSPKPRPSLLILNYWRPGRMAIFRYLCSDTFNPFADMRFNASLNDTIKLEPQY